MCPAARKNEYQKPVKCLSDTYTLSAINACYSKDYFLSTTRSRYLKLEASI